MSADNKEAPNRSETAPAKQPDRDKTAAGIGKAAVKDTLTTK